MRKIIIIRGVQNTGKSTSINEIYNWILSLNFQVINNVVKNSNGDILGTLIIGNLVIGFNSAGDNLREVKKIETLKDSNNLYPDIIICASRTKGEPFKFLKDNFNRGSNWLRIIHNKKRTSTISEQELRDFQTLSELKVRLIGLQTTEN